MKLILLTFAAASVSVASVETNPIQKVLSLLADLQKKVLLDGEIEQKQYEKFTAFCQDDATTKQYAIKNAKAKIESLEATIEKASADIQDADSTIGELAKTVATNQKDLSAATAIRDNERADYNAADSEFGETIDMLGRAVGIIEKEMRGGSFAQVTKASMKDLTDTLQVVMQASVLNEQDQDKLSALLQSGDGDDFLDSSAPDAAAYESHSGSIVDTLEDMKEKATAMRNDGQKAELNAKHAYELVAQSLNSAIKVDGKALDVAKGEKAAASEIKATAEGDLAMTQKDLAENEEGLHLLAQDCQQKAADWEMSTKSRGEELEALTQARKIIGDKTGGAAGQAYGFLEVASTHVNSGKVIDSLRQLGKKMKGDVALTQLALRAQAAFEMNSGADVFGKVRGMIQEMIEKLVAEAGEEADHKAWCDEQMAETQEKMDDHKNGIDKLSAKVDKAEATIAQLKESIAQLQKELAEVAKQQMTMDEIRREQKATYEVAKEDFTNGIEGLTMALQLLRDYYAAPADDEAALLQADAPTVSTHSASGGAASGIIGILEVAQSDFSKMLADAEADEKASSEMYEKMTHENNVATTMKGADVKYQTKEQAGLETSVADMKEDRESEQAELDAVVEYYAQVKPGCTIKPMTYEETKARREAEIDGLKQALTILEGEAPQAFLATRVARRS